MSEVLHIDEFSVDYVTNGRPVRAVDGVTLSLRHGECMAIVGESGSGKTTLGMSIGRLLPTNAHAVAGDIRLNGRSLLQCSATELRSMRRTDLGFVFQNPIETLNPSMRIGDHLGEVLQDPDGTRDLLETVGLADVPRVLRSYPHELSGGMAQRIGIVLAVARRPKLVVADEPTGSLDSVTRDKVMDLLVSLCRAAGTAIVLLTHDLRSVEKYCDRVTVMYGGRIAESGRTHDVFTNPLHPYTRALLRAIQGSECEHEWLATIPGVPPVLTSSADHCAFAPRCFAVRPECWDRAPQARMLSGRTVRCHRAGDLPVSASVTTREPGSER